MTWQFFFHKSIVKWGLRRTRMFLWFSLRLKPHLILALQIEKHRQCLPTSFRCVGLILINLFHYCIRFEHLSFKLYFSCRTKEWWWQSKEDCRCCNKMHPATFPSLSSLVVFLQLLHQKVKNSERIFSNVPECTLLSPIVFLFTFICQDNKTFISIRL